MLSGVLELVDGTPVSGAPILIQVRSVSRRGEVLSEQTLAETRTDPAGGWALDATAAAPVKGGLWLRVLCPGAAGVGACVSDPLHVQARLSLTAQTA